MGCRRIPLRQRAAAVDYRRGAEKEREEKEVTMTIDYDHDHLTQCAKTKFPMQWSLVIVKN